MPTSENLKRPVLEINYKCISCDNCVLICPENAVHVTKGDYFIEQWACTLCGFCLQVCPVDSIQLISYKEQEA